MQAPHSQKGSRKKLQPAGPGERAQLEAAYLAAFRPMVLAHHLQDLRRGSTSPSEVSQIKAVVSLALKLHLPLPKAYHGEPEALKRLALLQAEARFGHISPILNAVRRRLKLSKPKETEVPQWMIQNYQPPETQVTRVIHKGFSPPSSPA